MANELNLINFEINIKYDIYWVIIRGLMFELLNGHFGKFFFRDFLFSITSVKIGTRGNYLSVKNFLNKF